MVDEMLQREIEILKKQIDKHGDEVENQTFTMLSPTFQKSLRDLYNQLYKFECELIILREFLNISQCTCTDDLQCAKCEANKLIEHYKG